MRRTNYCCNAEVLKKQSPNKFSITGGHVNINEKEISVAFRETEEIGLKFE